MIKEIAKEYGRLSRSFGKYWSAYGGTRALVMSPYLHLTFALALASWGRWTAEGWWDDVIVVAPSLLGFTLGGLAIFLGLGDEKLKNTLANARADKVSHSLLISTSSNFLHFIVVQSFALAYAIIAQGTYFGIPRDSWIVESLRDFGWDYFVVAAFGRDLCWFLGYWLFLYSIGCALAAAHSTFMLVRWHDILLRPRQTHPGQQATANKDSASIT